MCANILQSAESLLHVSDTTHTQSTMCQLLGMNCAKPTDFTFSFTGFARRGGDTDKHQDGWGLVFYEGRGVRAFHDSLPAAKSPIADLVARYPCKTLNMISHIRYATEGARLLENVHPFQREMWGIQWVFAHNGDVPMFSSSTDDNSASGQEGERQPVLGQSSSSSDRGPGCNEAFYIPVGTTDSEAIFCAIMNALRHKFTRPPTLPVLHNFLQSLCLEIIEGHGMDDCVIFNFLLSAGEHILFAYSWPGARPGSAVWNGLFYTVRQHPFQMATLKDCEVCVDFSTMTEPDDCVAVIATAALTGDEVWIEFQKGQMIVFDHGRPLLNDKLIQDAEASGRGLNPSDAFFRKENKAHSKD
jgi:predicted glutamine amidotransferase